MSRLCAKHQKFLGGRWERLKSNDIQTYDISSAYPSQLKGAGSMANAMQKAKNKVGGNEYYRTELWREFSWRVGDTHATRICWLLTLYCRLFRIPITQMTHRMPNDWR